MKETHFIVEERFLTDSEEERKRLIQQKMERYLRHVLEADSLGPEPPARPEP